MAARPSGGYTVEMRRLALILPLILAACLPASQAAPPPPAPVVVELYQSQNCALCPPALGVLDRIADRPHVIALNFGVTYFDRPGARDSFAKPEFTQRQWDHSRAAGRRNVATPQMIVDGRSAVLGSRQPEVEAVIARHARPVGPPLILTEKGRLSVTSGPATPARIWVVDYDPRRLSVVVGQNGRARTHVYRNVVRHLAPIGRYIGKSVRLDPGPRRAGLERVVLIQATNGAIITARRI